MKASNLKVFAPLVFAALSLNGCDSGTVKPLCEKANGPIEGITGAYELNYRDGETFELKKSVFKIMPSDDQHKVQLINDKSESTAEICNVSGVYVFEGRSKSKDMDLGFEQGRIFISQVGIHIVPNMFDKKLLDAAGVPNKILVLPQSIRNIIGEGLSTHIDSTATSLISMLGSDNTYKFLSIDNSAVSAESIIHMSKPGPFGVTLYRQ